MRGRQGGCEHACPFRFDSRASAALPLLPRAPAAPRATVTHASVDIDVSSGPAPPYLPPRSRLMEMHLRPLLGSVPARASSLPELLHTLSSSPVRGITAAVPTLPELPFRRQGGDRRAHFASPVPGTKRGRPLTDHAFDAQLDVADMFSGRALGPGTHSPKLSLWELSQSAAEVPAWPAPLSFPEGSLSPLEGPRSPESGGPPDVSMADAMCFGDFPSTGWRGWDYMDDC